MYLADVMSIALSIVGFLASLQGLWLLCRALWPARVEAAVGQCERNPVRCFFVGLLLTAAFVGVVAVVGNTLGTPGQLAAFALALAYIVYFSIGVSGFVTLIGRRLASPADLDRPWRATIRGGVALELASLLPILGWVGILPISFMIGAGATTLTFFGKRKSRVEMPIPELPPRAIWQASSPPPLHQPIREPAEVMG